MLNITAHVLRLVKSCRVRCADRPNAVRNTLISRTFRQGPHSGPYKIWTEFSIDVQLKATSGDPHPDEHDRFPFRLELDHYDKLRHTGRQTALLLVVLFLPPDKAQWLVHSADCLISRRCAYWVSLRVRTESINQTSQTVYLPLANLFSVEGLRAVMTRVSRGDLINHEL